MITNLTLADFILRDAGKKVELESLDILDLRGGDAPPPAAVAAAAANPDLPRLRGSRVLLAVDFYFANYRGVRDTFRQLGLPMRPDLKPGHGSLGGILTAVDWAREEGCRGALVAACDMPFLSAGLLKQLAQDAEPTDVVAPASDSRRGLEPLCAFYGVATQPAIQAALERGDRQVVSFFPDVQLHVLPREEVAEFGEPDTLFLNVNTPEDRERAEQIAQRAELSKS